MMPETPSTAAPAASSPMPASPTAGPQESVRVH